MKQSKTASARRGTADDGAHGMFSAFAGYGVCRADEAADRSPIQSGRMTRRHEEFGARATSRVGNRRLLGVASNRST